MNKQTIATLLTGAALVTTGVVAATPPAPQKRADATAFVIRNVRVFDGEKTIAHTQVVVRDGKIEAIGGAAPSGLQEIDGTGRTLLPGLIDAHTHVFGDALVRALQFGVTTELDMFTDHSLARTLRAEQARTEGAPGRADLRSAGTLITAPGGHGTEYGMRIPTLESAKEAKAFVDARIAEGSDYIKIVYDNGGSYGLKIPTIDRATLEASVSAARAAGKLALVHIASHDAANDAIAAGASGLIHLFADRAPEPDFAARVRAAGAFVTPTLSVIQSTTGQSPGAALVEDKAIQSYLTPAERANLGAAFPLRPGATRTTEHSVAAVKALLAAGVPLLAGTDAPNPGTAHGVSMHRELDLLVAAGLTPEQALRAATSTPARIFGLNDRGRIAPGLRADLLLVEGDPTSNVTDTRRIAGIWKSGARVERSTATDTGSTAQKAVTDGRVSSFDDGAVSAAFGAGWQISTDSMMGGKSKADMKVVSGGASGTTHALEVSGEMVAGALYPWAGAMFFPASTPMTPVDLSKFKEIVFWTRGDGGSLMVFATRLGRVPAVHPFTASTEWREVVVPLKALGLDGTDVSGLLFSASDRPGPFRFAVDEVRFR
jgi:imidazolonepropionase-like amidohydrolase